MHDQNWQMSWDIQVTIEERPGPFFIVAYTLSDQWLSAPERVYPVIMDPQVRSSQVRSDIDDTIVCSHYRTTNYFYSSMLKSGYDASLGMTRSYINFPGLTTKTPISSADEIVLAELRLRHDTSLGSDTVQVNVHKVTGSWQDTSVTWDTQPPHDPRVYDFETFKSPGRWRTFDVTPIVKEWYRLGPNSIHGLMLKHENETQSLVNFFSSDILDQSLIQYRPYLRITYLNQSGIEGYRPIPPWAWAGAVPLQSTTITATWFIPTAMWRFLATVCP